MTGCIVVLVSGFHDSSSGTESGKIVDTMRDNIITMIIGCIAFLGLGSLLSLSLFHLYLILSGETSNESLRGVYKSIGNPFNKGCIGNCYNIFCEPVANSRIDDQSGIVLASDYINKYSSLINECLDSIKPQIEKDDSSIDQNEGKFNIQSK